MVVAMIAAIVIKRSEVITRIITRILYIVIYYIQYISHTPAYNMKYPYIYQKFPISWDNISTSHRLSHKNQIIQSQYYIISRYNIDTPYSRPFQIFPTRTYYRSLIFNKLILLFDYNYRKDRRRKIIKEDNKCKRIIKKDNRAKQLDTIFSYIIIIELIKKKLSYHDK